MNLYYELLKKPLFRMEDVLMYYQNIDSARTAVKRLVNQKMAAKIRNNLYTCISGESGVPIADRFQIASSINSTSFVSHHSAMDFYGLTDQVVYEVYVGSEQAFNDFRFDGYLYRFVRSRMKEGIDVVEFSGGVKISDKERTIIDCIKDMDKIGGAEEVIADIEMIRNVKEEKLTLYLGLYDNQFLYQKTGYILFHYQDRLALSEGFYEMCRNKAGKSCRYLTTDSRHGEFVSKWNLIVPKSLFNKKNGAEDADL